jgi:hypothetical protein
MTFGFGVRTETTSCPEMKVAMQHYDKQEPVEFIAATNFGTPTIRFSDGTVLSIKKAGEFTEYILTVSRTAIARVKKQYED